MRTAARAVLERDLAVSRSCGDSHRLLRTPPVAVWEIVYRLHLHRFHRGVFQVIDREVRRLPVDMMRRFSTV
jgi:hypothetical protein